MTEAVGGASERRAVLRVERGLYTLVYRCDPSFDLGISAAPITSVAGASEGIFLVGAPGEPFGLLARPGSGLVVLAEADGTLELKVEAACPGGSLAAEIELSRVEAPRAALSRRDGPVAPRTPLPDGGAEFVLRAHVSLRGDVAAARGSWICGPETPGRIEGFEVRPGDGAVLPIQYQVATAGRTAGWSSWFSAGQYAGSRGKALPLIGVRMRLADSAPKGLALKAEGLFLGASVTTRIGREIELVGPSPLDPLVGLKLDLTTAAEVAPTAPTPQTGGTQGRLRVFRRTSREAEAA